MRLQYVGFADADSARKAKEQYATSELQKLRNRMRFGEQEEEDMGIDESIGLGMIGTSSGRIRANAGETRTKAKMSKSNKNRLAALKAASGSGSSSTVAGLSSSLAFTRASDSLGVLTWRSGAGPRARRSSSAEAQARGGESGLALPGERHFLRPAEVSAALCTVQIELVYNIDDADARQTARQTRREWLSAGGQARRSASHSSQRARVRPAVYGAEKRFLDEGRIKRTPILHRVDHVARALEVIVERAQGVRCFRIVADLDEPARSARPRPSRRTEDRAG